MELHMSGFRVFFIVVLLSLSHGLMAGQGIDDLNAFSKNLDSFSAKFTQVVYDSKSKPLQESSGKLVLKRPGKFWWQYAEPNKQLIVSDAFKVWIYDEDLAQVTVNKVDSSLSNAPIMLLGTDTPLDAEFKLKELGLSDGIYWVELTPKKSESDFELIYLGLKKGVLAAMELRDNFGQATQIKFQDSKVNLPVENKLFNFEPPKGVDVLGE
jgi:outer membrane lipoprotein carrier protein